MNERTLARELVRARLAEVAELKNALEQMHANLEKMLRAQMELQTLLEDREEPGYELVEVLGDDGIVIAHEGAFSFGVLLEMVVNRLKAVGGSG
ncbi:hypothetical protein PHYPSEUDO_003004 [Phytophthora pseudosyringae]|uniref:Uncharacterized protein n=1 Tax=Phytophthora pseudosyringae TaxID=221518 RepID=A0A8T1VVP2_9STRA|nr:hypothetical protein PHYPSEUDO_003004 [Phytophthora pseudosyringae]